MRPNKVVLKIVTLGISTIVALLIIYATVSVSMVGFDFGYRVFTEPAMEAAPGTDIVVIIEDDMSELDIGEELERVGMVRDGKLFFIQLQLSVYKGKLIPGTYVLNTSMEPKEIMDVLSTPVETETESTES